MFRVPGRNSSASMFAAAGLGLLLNGCSAGVEKQGSEPSGQGGSSAMGSGGRVSTTGSGGGIAIVGAGGNANAGGERHRYVAVARLQGRANRRGHGRVLSGIRVRSEQRGQHDSE